MASYEKRGDTWRARVTIKGHPRESATFPTKAQAVAWAAKLEGELLAGRRGQIVHRSVKQALERYRDDVAPGHKGARWEAIRCNKLARELPFKYRRLSDVTASDVAAWRDDCLTRLAAGSVRREMGLLRSVFEHARKEWGWLRINPMESVARPASPPARVRKWEDAEIERLLAGCGYVHGSVAQTTAQRAAVAFLFAIETAMRAGEICGLTKDRLTRAERFLTLPKTKNGDARDVPLSKAALALLDCLPDSDPVFGIPGTHLDVAFRTAMKRAKITGLRFHDSRATALTRLSKKLDVLALAKMVGHRDPRSLMIYYRATATEIADRLD